jgi:hypothetical protein
LATDQQRGDENLSFVDLIQIPQAPQQLASPLDQQVGAAAASQFVQ